MKNHIRNVLAVIGTTVIAGMAQAMPADFVGTWTNLNPSTRGIVKVVITPALQMQNFGACTPALCDMGAVQMVTYGNSVADLNHKFGTAHYDLSFKKIEVVAKLTGNKIMTVETFNRFIDGSGRQNYYSGERYKKVAP